MKTTLELPNDLAQQIKQRAVAEGRQLQDVAADLLRAALAASPNSEVPARAAVPKTLPIIKGRSTPPENSASMTAQKFCEWVKQVLEPA